MKYLFVILFVIGAVFSTIFGYPVEENKTLSSGSNTPFIGQPFDEIVVESVLNVRRKTDTRQAKNQKSSGTEVTPNRNRRQIYHQQLPEHKHIHRHNNFPNDNFPNFPNFGSAMASAQAQSHDAKSPFGNFGASASGAQSQSLNFGPNGPVGTASFAGTQQYRLPNGQTVDISFGNALGTAGSEKAGGATIAIRGP